MTDLRQVRWSWLRSILRSPAHCRYTLDHGIEETQAMRLGTAVHHILLGGPHEFVTFDGGARRGKHWDAFEAANPGKTILLASETMVAAAMAASVASTPHAMEALEGAQELELTWKLAGRDCGGRVDVLGTDLVELKTGWDINPARYYWQALRLGYFAQLGWYYDGLLAAGRPEPRISRIVAVESKPPYPVMVYDVGPTALDVGRKQARLAFERLLVCEASNDWPGYAAGPVLLEAPEYEGDVVLTGSAFEGGESAGEEASP